MKKSLLIDYERGDGNLPVEAIREPGCTLAPIQGGFASSRPLWTTWLPIRHMSHASRESRRSRAVQIRDLGSATCTFGRVTRNSETETRPGPFLSCL
jgi:hypothetical protein